MSIFRDDLWHAPMTGHVNYPHQGGDLYDCPACESHCYCNKAAVRRNEETPCIYCSNRRSGLQGQEPMSHDEEFDVYARPKPWPQP